jgi:cytochrome c peroxidase
MSRTLTAIAALGLGAVLALPAVAGTAITFSAEELRRIQQHSPLPAPPPDPTNRVADRRDAALLGQRLFFEPRLSASGRTSCASCHDPAFGWSNGQPMAAGDRRATRRHVPTLWNAAYGRWFFWDGRADSLWSQALEALEGELDQASNRLRIAHAIEHDSGLRTAYEGTFGAFPDLADLRRFPADGRPDPDHPEGLLDRAWSAMSEADRQTIDRIFVNLGKAIAAFERRLISRDSPFDRFAAGLRTGNRAALQSLSPSAQRGLQLFVGKTGCWQCHAGPNFSDGEFHRLGVPERSSFHDLARMRGILLLLSNPFNGVGAWSDAPAASPTRFLPRGETHAIDEFKTPTLRNVANTAPYMHNGRLATLEDVVRFYSEQAGAPTARPREKILRPLHLSDGEMVDLVAFLKSLTGKPLEPALMGPQPARGARRASSGPSPPRRSIPPERRPGRS